MTCYVSKGKMVGLLLLDLLMVAAAVFCTTLPELKAQLAGWAGLAFFGFGLVILGRQVFRQGPEIKVDGHGITHHRWALGTIPWSDIERVWIGSVHSARFICMKLRDPDMYLHKLPAVQKKLAAMNQNLGFGDLHLGFQGMKPGLDEVWAYILENQLAKTPFATPNA